MEQSEQVDVLRGIWTAEGQSAAAVEAAIEEQCGPQKTCRNMKQVSFDGMAEPGTDLRAAWRERLAREGKLGSGEGSIRELVLGTRE